MVNEFEIGNRIKETRRSRGLTLRELATRTGLTKGYLSKIESSPKAPPISTLINLSSALQVNLSTILGQSEEPSTLCVVRKNERQDIVRDGSTFGYSYKSLAHKYPYKKMEPYIVTAPAKVKKKSLFQHPGEELQIVLKGTLRFHHGDHSCVLEEGDCVYFDSGIPHRGEAVGGEDVVVFMVIYTT